MSLAARDQDRQQKNSRERGQRSSWASSPPPWVSGPSAHGSFCREAGSPLAERRWPSLPCSSSRSLARLWPHWEAEGLGPSPWKERHGSTALRTVSALHRKWRRCVFAVMVLSITVSLLWLIFWLGPEEKEIVPFMPPPKTAVVAAVLAGAASPNGVSEVRCDRRKAYVQAELDDLHELHLFIGSDALGWSAQQTGSTSVTATVEAADQIKLDDGSTGHGLIFQAWSVRHNIAITPDGPVPYGEVVFRTNSMITQKNGTFTFADIHQTNGTLVPVSIRVRPRPA